MPVAMQKCLNSVNRHSHHMNDVTSSLYLQHKSPAASADAISLVVLVELLNLPLLLRQCRQTLRLSFDVINVPLALEVCTLVLAGRKDCLLAGGALRLLLQLRFRFFRNLLVFLFLLVLKLIQ